MHCTQVCWSSWCVRDLGQRRDSVTFMSISTMPSSHHDSKAAVLRMAKVDRHNMHLEWLPSLLNPLLGSIQNVVLLDIFASALLVSRITVAGVLGMCHALSQQCVQPVSAHCKAAWLKADTQPASCWIPLIHCNHCFVHHHTVLLACAG